MTELALGRTGAPARPGRWRCSTSAEGRVALDEFGRLMLRNLRELGRALAGDIGGAIDDLVLTADAFDAAGMAAEAVGVHPHRAHARGAWRIDAVRGRRASSSCAGRLRARPLHRLRRSPPCTYRRAQLLWQRDDQAAGPLLFEAYARPPPPRRGPVGRRPAWPTSGWWRANHGRPRRPRRPRRRVDRPPAPLDGGGRTLGLARLAVLLADADRRDEDARLLAAAAVAPRPAVGHPAAARRAPIRGSTPLATSTRAEWPARATTRCVALLRTLAAG